MDSRLVSHWHQVSDRGSPAESDFISIADVSTFLRRYVQTIGACVLVALACAWFYLATTDRIYTAQTQILIEPKISQLLQQQQTEVNLTLDTAQVESQMAVMQSEKIAKMVIDELQLTHDSLFNRSHSPTFTERLGKLAERAGLWRAGTGYARPASGFERDRGTMWAYSAGLDVRRVGVSYAINIAFRSLDPELSAKVANATAEAFVREQMETKSASAREGGEWLELRLNELREQMNQATQVAQEFRSKHDYGVGPAVGGDQASQAGEGKNSPTLEELEVTADTYRKMYESFLQAYTNSVSQQSYPVADARVITTATPPLGASSPRPKLLVAFAILAGLMVGVGVAFLRHTLDPSIKSSRQLREEFGLECLGELPPLSGETMFDEAVISPSSRYSNSLKCVKTAIGLADSASSLRCIGVVSALPSDGKSSFASNLAALYAMSGSRTLIVDADVCHSVLSGALLPVSSPGEGDVNAATGTTVSQFIAPVANATFDLLPSAVADARGLLASRNMRVALPELQSYDMIIVDLPPLTCGSDRLATTPLFDGVILIAEWGRTPIDLFGELVRSMHASKTSILGVAMTNVRVSSTRMYNGHGRRKAR
ncbi:GumC family protein [Aminobacter sp. HY435]|uniref:GumC family protein n=1 Tax=Aminobacter sp. HY435 TaxID=2970917 RepID=UPI0022B9645B|nr:GNVR domain-containing protein [Aminobacter sp. HY435]